MPQKVLYPDADLTGTHQLNTPLAVDGTVSPLIPKGSTTAVYEGADELAPADVDGITYGLTVPPEAEVGDTCFCFAWAMDETAGTELGGGDVPTIAGTNEVQRLASDRTGGTFTLTFGGNVTGNLNADTATASEVQTELEGLASIGVGDISVTGGPLTGDDILIEFTGTLADTDQALIVVTDSGTGGTAVTMTEETAGVGRTSFSLEFSINVPHAGGDGEPEVHVWSRDLTAADVSGGKTVNVTVSDHGNLDSWAVALVAFENVHATAVEVQSADNVGNGNGVDWSTETPLTDGAYMIASAAWCLTGGGNFGAGDVVYPNNPDGMDSLAYPESDSIVAAVWGVGPLAEVDYLPEPISWGPNRDYTAFQMILKPATEASTAANLYEVVDDQDESDYLELRAALGSVYEIVELDLTEIPTGSVITGVRAEFSHYAPQSSQVRVFPVGISAGGGVTVVDESTLGYTPTPLAQHQTQSTEEWTILADDTRWTDHPRMGIAIIQTQSPNGVSSHRISWVRAVVSYDTGGPEVSNVAGPTLAADPVTWDYLNIAGRPQTHYQVMLIAGTGQDPTTATPAGDPANPADGEYFHDSGRLVGESTRSYDLSEVPLVAGNVTAAVRAWSLLSNGVSYASDWDTDNYNLGGALTAGSQTDTPEFAVTEGGIEVDADPVPATATRAWLWRSEDSGTTWELAGGSPFAVTSPGPITLVDRYTPANVATLRYQISYDAGSGEVSAPEEFPGGDVSSALSTWYFIDPTATVTTAVPDIRGYQITKPRRSITADQPGRSATAVSPLLATRIDLSIRTSDAADRAAIEAFLDPGIKFRVIDILGRSWLMRPDSGQDVALQRAQPLSSEATELRDFHYINVSLVEVSE